MIESISITGLKYDIDEKTRGYIEKKIGRLDRYLPKHARQSVGVDVKVGLTGEAKGDTHQVEVIFVLPSKKLTAKGLGSSVNAATDVVEEKIEGQLRRYKTENTPHLRERRSILARFKRISPKE